MLVRDANPKGDIINSGYYRLTGCVEIARFLRRVHSTVIRNGNELESVVYEHSQIKEKKKNFKSSVEETIPRSKCLVVGYKIPKEISHLESGIALDIVLLTDEEIFICELKDGQNFDTKKSAGEVEKLLKAEIFFAAEDTRNRRITLKIILWNCPDVKGSSFKDKRGVPMLVSGRDFSKKIGVDFDEVVKKRSLDQKENRKYIIEKMEEVGAADKRRESEAIL
jgi:hypothetical protein